jgi:hypothetical protein
MALARTARAASKSRTDFRMGDKAGSTFFFIVTFCYELRVTPF